MTLLNDMQEEYRENVYNAIDSGGSKGVSLKEICEEVFGNDDSIDVTDFDDENMKVVFETLDDLLEEEAICFDVEQDLWKCIGV